MLLTKAVDPRGTDGSKRIIAKLADFGLLVPIIEGMNTHGGSSSIKGVPHGLTGEVGSCIHMSPEVKKCKPYNQKTDIFSFGVMMFEAFSRHMLVMTADVALKVTGGGK